MSAIDTASLVMAQAAAPEGGALMGMLPIILMFVILYFLMIRPQMKRQKEHRNLIAALAKGDEVVTAGGMLGKVTKVNDSYVTVEVSELAEKPVEIIMQKSSVSAVLPKEPSRPCKSHMVLRRAGRSGRHARLARPAPGGPFHPDMK